MSHKHRHKNNRPFQKRKNKQIKSNNSNSKLEKELTIPMIDSIRENIIYILKESIKALDKEPIDIFSLESLSNQTIHSISIYQDKDSMNISIILYSLYKLLTNKLINKKDLSIIKEQINNSVLFLSANNFKKYRLQIAKILKLISNTNKKFNLYVQSIIDKAKIKKGSELYRHGISIGMISELFGTSEWEIMSYIGKTNLNESLDGEDPIKRLKIAEEFFGLK